MQNLRIGTTEYTVSEPRDLPNAGRHYILTGPRGAAYLATLAYIGDSHTFKVLSGRSMTELRNGGNAVRLSDASGELRSI